MPRHTVKPEPAPVLISTGKYVVVVDYLDPQGVSKVEIFYVKDTPAGLARMRKIMQEGMLTTEHGMDCIYPPHRILKISVGEQKVGAQS